VYTAINKHSQITLAIILFLVCSTSTLIGSFNLNLKVSAQTDKPTITTRTTSDLITDHVATLVAKANGLDFDKENIKQTLSQIDHLTEAKGGKDQSLKYLLQIEQETTLNPKGSVSQALIRFTQENKEQPYQENAFLDETIATALRLHTPLPDALTIAAVLTISTITQNTIDSISEDLSASTGISKTAYQEILQQLALDITNTDGKNKADLIINYRLPQYIAQQNARQIIIQPLSRFAWDHEYGHIDSLDQDIADITSDIHYGRSSFLLSPSIERPSFVSPSEDYPDHEQQYSSPFSTTSATPHEDLRSLDSAGSFSSSSNENGQDSQLDNNNTPQQDLRSIDSGHSDGSLESNSNSGDSGEQDSSSIDDTPQQDLRSMDISSTP
jgi:hypothetical protein